MKGLIKILVAEAPEGTLKQLGMQTIIESSSEKKGNTKKQENYGTKVDRC